MVLSLTCMFVMDTVLHLRDNRIGCLFSSMDLHNSTAPHPVQDTSPLIVQCTLSALSTMLIEVSLYEFICSQSLRAMNGLLIGMSYLIRGISQITASIVVLLFSIRWAGVFFPSCGMVYYSMNLLVGLVALAMYAYVARRYKYRMRDEPSRIYQYAENYYSNIR